MEKEESRWAAGEQIRCDRKWVEQKRRYGHWNSCWKPRRTAWGRVCDPPWPWQSRGNALCIAQHEFVVLTSGRGKARPGRGHSPAPTRFVLVNFVVMNKDESA